MRTYGRVPVNPADPTLGKRWVEVTTDARGFNDHVYLTALAQTLLLNLGESPFWADRGIPAKQSVLQQIAPDYWVNKTQLDYSAYFASLILFKVETPTPTYVINALLNTGARLNASVPIPT